MNHLQESLHALCRHLKLDIGKSVILDAGRIESGEYTYSNEKGKFFVQVSRFQYATITRLK